MSALTDLFTALANKIRSKTGTATTYTPLQMVSDGIDDVYAAGYDAGGGGATGIPITPSNASPVSLTTGDSYEMLANGYAISSYNNLSPSNSTPAALADDTIYKTNGTGYAIDSYSSITPSNSSPVSLSSGSIYKMGGAGKAVASVTDVTPSTISPASLSGGNIYKPSANGYAIDSYQTINVYDGSSTAISNRNGIYKISKEEINSPATVIGNTLNSITPTSSAQTLSSGSVYKMNGTGYVYSSQPTGGFSETALWTNSAPTSNFAEQSVTLSQSFTNFDYIKINFRVSTSTSTSGAILVSKEMLQQATGNNVVKPSLCCNSGGTGYARSVNCSSNTSLTIAKAYKFSSTSAGTSTSVAIPTSIVGLKFTP